MRTETFSVSLWSALLLVVVISLAVALAEGVYRDAITWSTAGGATASIVQAGADTSQTFALVRGIKAKEYDHVDKLGIALNTTETNDSTYVIIKLQVTADNTNWDDFSTLDTLIVADEDVVLNVSTTSLPPCYWGRYIITGAMAAGDTVAATGRILRSF